MSKNFNKNEVEKVNIEDKTFSIGSVFIVVILFVIVISIFTFARNVKANEILVEISKLDKEIKNIEKEIKVLSAKEAEYSSPNRFIEIAIMNGFISAKGNDDILYLKIESDNNLN